MTPRNSTRSLTTPCLAGGALLAASMGGCTRSSFHADEPGAHEWPRAAVDVLHFRDIAWQQLNPARGDQSPRAGTLWGDRHADAQTGFLVQFVDGFSSPPHIHNVTYRGVVISGLVHNDDPSAARMWMPAGSFWTQPKGEVHITAARGDASIAYIEIDAGPYLVLPSPEAFDSGERPVNIDAANVVWQLLDGSGPVQSALLWGQPSTGRPHGRFIKLPAGFDGEIRFDSDPVRGVVIRGELSLGAWPSNPLVPGSGFSVHQPGAVVASSGADSDSIVYLRMSGGMDVRSQ